MPGGSEKTGFVRINALMWADILVAYALFMMQDYLTDVWKLEFTHAAGIMNIWGGICKVLPLFFLFFVDTILGHFKMLAFSSISFCVGMSLVAMSMPPVLGTCKRYEAECIGQTQKVLMYVGMALIAVGGAGNLVSIKPFREAQADINYPSRIEYLRLLGFVILGLAPIVGFFVFPYINQWLLLFGVPGICVLCATLLFLTGWKSYEKIGPEGSPLTGVCRVLVAAALNISQPLPADPSQLYHEYAPAVDNSFPPSRMLRWLDKAAIRLPGEDVYEQMNRWRLCSVQQVEAAKFVVSVIPIGATFIMCTIVSSVGNTFLVEQGSHMNRNLGKWKVPSQVLLGLLFMGRMLFDKLAGCLVKRSGKHGPPMEIAVAILLSILCCVSAALIEMERLKVAKRHGLLDKPEEGLPMPMYWLFFPFFLLAGLDSFFSKGVDAFYERGSPECLIAYCRLFTCTVSGLGLMYSVISVHVVGKISEIGGRQNWFQNNLNKSRLDLYYWVLAGLSALNLLIYITLASLHRYRLWETHGEVV